METFGELFSVLADLPMKLPAWKNDKNCEAIASERWSRQAICALIQADILVFIADPTDPVEDLLQDEIYDCIKGMRDDLIKRRVDDLIFATSRTTT